MTVNGYGKIILGALLTATLALAAWGGKTLVAHSIALAAQEERQSGLKEWLGKVESRLESIEGKLDRLDRHLR